MLKTNTLISLFLILLVWPAKKSAAQCASCTYPGASVVLNGDFSLGNLLFSSDYTPAANLLFNNTYVVGSNAASANPSFIGSDHSSGSGNFLMVNGGSTSGVAAWSQTLVVIPNTDYNYEAWISSLSTINPGTLQFAVNGTPIGSSLNAPSGTGTWVKLSGTWNSGSNTLITLSIVSLSTAVTGNDFGIDDIRFVPCLSLNVNIKADAGLDIKACVSVSTGLGNNSLLANVTFLWSPPGPLSDATSNNPILTYTNLGSSPETLSFVLQVDSAGLGCISRDTVQVILFPQPVPALGPDVHLCAPNYTISTAASHDSLLWNNGLKNVSSILADSSGSYAVTVYKYGCVAYDTIEVLLDTMPYFSLPPDITKCVGHDTLIVSPAIGLWNTGSTSNQITADTAGLYIQTRINGLCSFADSIQVMEVPEPVIGLLPDTLICDTASFTLNAAQSVLWNTGLLSNALIINNSGTYWARYTGPYCTVSDTVSIELHRLDLPNLDSLYLSCSADSIVVSIPTPNGSTLSWSGGYSGNQAVLTQSDTLIVSSSLGSCLSIDTAIVLIKGISNLNLPDTIFICQGMDTLLQGPSVPDAIYQWTGGLSTPEIRVGSPGTYVLNVSNSHCQASDSTVLVVLDTPQATLPSAASFCQGGTLNLGPAPLAGLSYLWNTGQTSSSITVNSPGTYSLSISNRGCTVLEQSNITQDVLPSLALIDSLSLCSGSILSWSPSADAGLLMSWLDQAPANPRSFSQGGWYYFTASKGTCSLSDSIYIEELNQPNIQFDPLYTLCSDSSLSLSAPQHPDFVYQWNTGANTPSINISQSGNYSLICYNQGCADTAQFVVNFDPLPVSVMPDSAYFCSGQSVNLSASSTGAVSVTWSNGAVGNSIVVNQEGWYEALINKGACSVLDSTYVEEKNLPLLSLNAQHIVCTGDSVLVQAQTQPGTLNTWSNGAVGSNFYAKSAGMFTIQSTNGFCAKSASTQVLAQMPPLGLLPPTSSFCDNQSATLIATNNPLYTVSWSNGHIGPSLPVNSPGLYVALISDGTCSFTDSTTVNFKQAPTISLPDTLRLCPGADSSVWAQVSAGTVVWNGGILGPLRNISSAGTYTATVNHNGCSQSTSLVALSAQAPIAGFQPEIQQCENQITVLDAGLQNQTSYLWSTGQNTHSIAVSDSGWYYVHMQNQYCSSLDSVHVLRFEMPKDALDSTIRICENQNLVLHAPLPKTQVLWSNGSTADSITITNTGWISILAQNGPCMLTDSVYVELDSLPFGSLSAQHILCADSSVILETPFNPAYSYIWNGVLGNHQQSVSDTGTYLLEIKQGACSLNLSTKVVPHADPQLNLPDTLWSCDSVSLFLSSANTGLQSYLWNTGQNTSGIQINTPGQYILRAFDGTCWTTDTTAVELRQMPVITAPDSVQICEGQSKRVILSPSAYTQIQWFPNIGGNDVYLDSAGVYRYTIQNGACVKSDSLIAHLIRRPQINLPISAELCENDSFLINITEEPGVSYAWTDGVMQANRSLHQAGTYILNAFRSGCAFLSAIALNDHGRPSTGLPSNLAECTKDSLVITIPTQAPYLYQWSDGTMGGQITVRNSGVFTLSYQDAWCTYLDSVRVQLDSLPVVTAQKDLRICAGDSVEVNLGSPLYTYSWVFGDTSRAFLRDSGVYPFTVQNGACLLTDSLRLTSYLKPVLNLSGGAICMGDTGRFTWNREPDVLYIWNTADAQEPQVTDSSLYTIQALRGACLSMDSARFKIYLPPTLGLSDTSLWCENTELILSGASDSTLIHLWTDHLTQNQYNTPSLHLGMSPGYEQIRKITLLVSNPGCTRLDSTVVIAYPLPSLDLGTDIDTCADVVNLRASGEFDRLLWNTGQSTDEILVNTSGLYMVTAWNAYCLNMDSIKVQLDKNKASGLPSDTVLCSNQNLVLWSNVSGTWSTGQSGRYILVTQPGTYYFSASTGACSSTDTIRVRAWELAILNLSDTELCEGEIFSLPPIPDGASYRWIKGEVRNGQITQSGQYILELTNNCGTHTERFTVFDADCSRHLYIPTAFTPNEDGHNDLFSVVSTGYDDINLTVYDRWGEVIVNIVGNKPSWDGYYRGNKVMSGSYPVSVVARYTDKKSGKQISEQISGRVSVLY